MKTHICIWQTSTFEATAKYFIADNRKFSIHRCFPWHIISLHFEKSNYLSESKRTHFDRNMLRFDTLIALQSFNMREEMATEMSEKCLKNEIEICLAKSVAFEFQIHEFIIFQLFWSILRLWESVNIEWFSFLPSKQAMVGRYCVLQIIKCTVKMVSIFGIKTAWKKSFRCAQF